MDYVIRPVRAGEWQLVKELRLAALRDPVAPVAFLETYEQGVERPDAFWRERAAGSSETGDGEKRQFVAVAPDGSWAGSVTVLIERPDAEVPFGTAADVHQAHVVGVFVRPEARGGGVAEELFRAGDGLGVVAGRAADRTGTAVCAREQPAGLGVLPPDRVRADRGDGADAG